jgi:hypothetical protein
VGDGGICYVFVFEIDCVRMAFAFGGLDITCGCVIMFWGGEEIPPQIATSAAFCQWHPGGTNSMFILQVFLQNFVVKYMLF